jgi:hypothetical protein
MELVSALVLLSAFVVGLFAVGEAEDISNNFNQCEPTLDACTCFYSEQLDREYCDYICPLDVPDCLELGNYSRKVESVRSELGVPSEATRL